MSSSPDISVVMSVYNGAAQLRETCDSVLGQTGVDLELIVVNDGSSDETAEILQEYATRDSRVKLVDTDHQGLTKALIQGCLIARGKYIARQDVGDTSHHERLRQQQKILDASPSVVFVSSWTNYAGPRWEHLYTVKSNGKATTPIHILPDSRQDLLVDGPTHHGSVMFRKDAYIKVGGYREEFYFAQDFDLWLRLAEEGMFQMLEAPLYRARITPGSLSSTNKKLQEALSKLCWDASHARRAGASEQPFLDRAAKLKPRQRKAKSSYRRSMGYYFIGEILRKNNDERAASYLTQAVREFPFSVKPWLRLAQTRLRSSS